MLQSAPDVRAAAVAGSFYPADARELEAVVEHMMASVPTPHGGEELPPKALIVPHAGYVYSGPTAGHAYALLRRTLRGRVRRVVLLGPAHRVAFQGIALPSVSGFQIPTGTVPLDRAGCAAASTLAPVIISDEAHAFEHSIEVQLPFLLAALGAFELVPLLVGRASPHDVASVIEALWGGDETLIIISSDLSHYLAHPDARAIDARTAASIVALESDVRHEQACGATPVNALLVCARRHHLRARVLDLRNSGDTAGPRERVVGYCSIALDAVPAHGLHQRGETAASVDDAGVQVDHPLGAALLARARNAIARVFEQPVLAEPAHPALTRPGATFVTLTLRGALRGCIGSLQAHRMLELDVRQNAVAAAFRDPRFEPLTLGEFRQVRVEVSLLGAAEPLAVHGEAQALSVLRPHRDGLIFDWRGRRATFLPQVWESLSEPEQFLRQLKRKAGLPEDFWAEDVVLSRYEVSKWQEHAGGAP